MSRLLPGVYIAYRKDGSLFYRSSITVKNKHISLGSYQTEVEANQAYVEASTLLSDKEVYLDDYIPGVYSLSFPKWVTICNFRDNGVYFANPIYVRPKFFYYYFSPDDFFIFSKEDLFYYAAHKIQKRGGHFFVSDYGSQINIYSRYGIMSYAVEGRDYVFLNGNTSDLQYGNVQILNSYHGVLLQDNVYLARIHVNGYLKIGVYSSAIEAAIAYNKAADIIKEAGIDKQFPTNYIDGLSPKSYADIYSNLSISENIISLSNQ